VSLTWPFAACAAIASGGGEFGEVYKAKWHGSYVAAKVLKRSDEIALGDFRTEIAILRKIHHPNCVQVRDRTV
jgi:serine/threonine protein kinase